MATAGESGFYGREGSGEAQVIHPKVSPFLVFAAQQDQRRAANETQNQRYSYQNQQKRNADIEKYIGDNAGTNPGWFQQENSTHELNTVRSQARDFAFQNPAADVSAVSRVFGDEKNHALRRIGKRSEVQKEIEMLRSNTNNTNSLYDSQWVNAQANKAYDTDVDKIGKGEVISIASHPRAYDADKGIIKSVKDVTSQSSYTGKDGKPQDLGWGMQIEGHTNKVRFKTDDNGRILPETVNFVLDSDPAIGQRLRWDYARKMAGVPDDTFASPEQMQKIQENYKKIQFSDDKDVTGYVQTGVRKVLGQLQKTEYIDREKIHNYPSSVTKGPTEVDVNNRRTKIDAIVNAFGQDYKNDTPDPKAIRYLSELRGTAKFAGLPVSEFTFVKPKIRTGGKGGSISDTPKLIIHLKTGVSDDKMSAIMRGDFNGEKVKKIANDIVEVPLNGSEGTREILNNLYNSTNPTTKEPEITGDKLRGQMLDLTAPEGNSGGYALDLTQD